MLRKTTSLVLALSGTIMLLTSVVLFIQPEGRVAYWSGWTLLGLGKKQWGDLHITIGTLFVVALILHAALNWKALANYISMKARSAPGTRPLAAASALTLLVAAGTLYDAAPFKQFMELNTWIKNRQAQVHGNPPYGHAELSTLRQFLGHLGVDETKGLQALDKAGIRGLSGEMTVKEAAERNGITPQALFEAVRIGTSVSMPVTPPEGTGKMTLNDLCAQFGADPAKAAKALEAAGIEARGDLTIKQMAAAKGVAPTEVYTIIRESQAR